MTAIAEATPVTKRGPGRPRKQPVYTSDDALTDMRDRLDALEAENTTLKSQSVASPALSGSVTANDVAAIIGAVQDTAPIKKVTWAQMKTTSSFRTDHKKAKKFTRSTYQNGIRLFEKLLFDTEIELLNTLPAGRFIDNTVIVTVVDGASGEADQVHVDYPCASHDHRLRNAGLWNSFEDLLRKCHSEALAATV